MNYTFRYFVYITNKVIPIAYKNYSDRPKTLFWASKNIILSVQEHYPERPKKLFWLSKNIILVAYKNHSASLKISL